MPDSLTPFERPNMRFEEAGGRSFCQPCSHDFEPEPEGGQVVAPLSKRRFAFRVLPSKGSLY